ncbi:hypothetical protein [Streptomyces lydicus]
MPKTPAPACAEGPFAKVYRENDPSALKKRKAVKPNGLTQASPVEALPI